MCVFKLCVTYSSSLSISETLMSINLREFILFWKWKNEKWKFIFYLPPQVCYVISRKLLNCVTWNCIYSIDRNIYVWWRNARHPFWESSLKGVIKKDQGFKEYILWSIKHLHDAKNMLFYHKFQFSESKEQKNYFFFHIETVFGFLCFHDGVFHIFCNVGICCWF